MAVIHALLILLCIGQSDSTFYPWQPFLDPACHVDCTWEFVSLDDGDFVTLNQSCTTLDYNDNGDLSTCPIPTENADVNDRAAKADDVTLEELTKRFDTGDPVTTGNYTCLRLSYTINEAVASKLQGVQFIMKAVNGFDHNMQFCQNHDHGGITDYYAVQELSENEIFDLRVFTYDCFCGILPGSSYDVVIRTLPVDHRNYDFDYDTAITIKYPEDVEHSSTCKSKPDDKRCSMSDAALWYPDCYNIEQMTAGGRYDVVRISFDIAPTEYGFDEYRVSIAGDTLVRNLLDWVEEKYCNGAFKNVTRSDCTGIAPVCNSIAWIQAFPDDKCVYEGGKPIPGGCPVVKSDPFCVIGNPCDASPCGKGECQPNWDNYTCECNPGYLFLNGTCIVDSCYDNPCNDTAGWCERVSDDGWKDPGYDCTCYEGYVLSVDGSTCVVDPCYNNPCNITAGECVRESDVGSNYPDYSCNCHDGFTKSRDGNTCVVNPCYMNPCVNGSCYLGSGGGNGAPWQYYCICDEGFSNSTQVCKLEKSGNLDTILAAVFGTIGALLLLGVFFSLVKYQTQKKHGEVAFHPTKPGPVEPINLHLYNRPRVYILYSEDHELHKEAIRMLATFLQQFCNLQIRLDMWCLTDIGDKKKWLYSEITNADKVLIIFSKGTLCKWQAAMTKEEVHTGMAGEFGDMFLPGYLYSSVEFDAHPELLKTKYVAAYFEYSQKDHVLPDVGNIAKYEIPKNLEALYFKLHNITKYSPRSSRRAPGLSPETFHLASNEGMALYSAIEQMKITVKDVPDWYENRQRSSNSHPDEGYLSQHNSSTETPQALADFFSPARSVSEDTGSSNFSRHFDDLQESHGATELNDPSNDIEGLEFGGTMTNVQICNSDSNPFEGNLNAAFSGIEPYMNKESVSNDTYQFDNQHVLHTLDADDIQIHTHFSELQPASVNYMPDYHIADGIDKEYESTDSSTV